jgi:hypothetical protein
MRFRPSFSSAIHLLSVCISSLLLSGVSEATSLPHAPKVVFVSENGSDRLGDGSKEHPWASLAHACKEVTNPESEILLLPGSYMETTPCKLVSQVNIVGAGPNKTIVRSRLNNWLIFAVSPKIESGAQQISGFTIDGVDRSLRHGILVQRRHNVEISNMVFREIDEGAIQVIGEGGTDGKGSPHAYVHGIKISENSFVNCAKDYETWSGGCVQIGHLDGGRIFNNRIKENIGAGIKQWAGGWFKRTKIYGNQIEVPSSDKAWGADISIELWNVSDDCQVYGNTTNSWISLVLGSKGEGVYSVRAYDNTIRVSSVNKKEAIELAGVSDAEIFGNRIDGAMYGVAMWNLPHDRLSKNNIIHHNIFANRSEGEGIRIHRGDKTEIYNNTFINLNRALGLHPTPQNIDDTRFINNLLVNVQLGIVTIAHDNAIVNTLVKRNNFHNVVQSIAEWGRRKTVVRQMDNIALSPDSIDNSHKPAEAYLQASALTVLADKGVDVGLPYCGQSPDIGAHEWCGK